MSKREIRRPSNTVTRGQTTAFMRASSVQVLLTDRYMQKIRKEGGENSRKYLGKRLVKQLARKAAAARPKKRKQTAQKTFVFDEGKGLSSEKQQYDTTSAINEVRSYVDTWRALPNPSQWQVTPETARLLQHWRKSEGRSIRQFFCQVEAVETAIWLTEVAPHSRNEPTDTQSTRGLVVDRSN